MGSDFNYFRRRILQDLLLVLGVAVLAMLTFWGSSRAFPDADPSHWMGNMLLFTAVAFLVMNKLWSDQSEDGTSRAWGNARFLLALKGFAVFNLIGLLQWAIWEDESISSTARTPFTLAVIFAFVYLVDPEKESGR